MIRTPFSFLTLLFSAVTLQAQTRSATHAMIKGSHALMLVFALGLLGACSVYQPNVAQGNIVTPEQLSALRQGMSRQQVQQTLGSPLLQDVFNASRWDYIYRLKKSATDIEQRTLTVFFDTSNRLTRWQTQGYNENPTANPAAPQTAVAAPPVMAGSSLSIPPSNTSAGGALAGALSLKADLPLTDLGQRPASATPPPAAPVQALAPTPVPISAPTPAPIPAPTPASVPVPVVSPTPVLAAPLRPAAPVAAPAAKVVDTVQPKATLIDTYDQVEKKLAAWKAAWMQRDHKAYISHYAAGYKADAASASAWQAQRQRVLAAAGNIELSFSDLKIIPTSQTEVRVSMTQTYKSTNLNETGQKQLFLQRIDGEWKIVSEIFSK